MGTWSVSTSGLNYIMEYTNGFKRSIRKNQVTKSNTSLGEEYASSQSPNLVLAYINALIQNYSFSAKFSAVSSLDLTSCFLDSNGNDCATLINWGDGTIDSNLTHTYSISGDYVISVVCEDAVSINVNGKSIIEFNYALPSGLQSLDLSNNQIVDFNPNIPLPIGLQFLVLNSNQIVDFNPSIALPSGLQGLDLSGNQIVDFNPSIALPIGLQELDLGGNHIVDFNPSIALPIGLQSLGLVGNQIVDFNPAIVLPTSLNILNLYSNQMTIAGYTASETWANAQPSFTSSCNVYFTNNIDSVSGTDLETILISKNCTVIV